MFEAALFDLDGTFADTAPDLGAALNRLRHDLGLEPVALPTLRRFTSQGVRGMLGAGLGVGRDDPRYDELSRRFLDHYESGLCVHTRLFDGIAALVDGLEARGIPWGIVTNKTARFTLPLLAGLGCLHRAACVVSGDSTARPKPAPDPLLLASEQIGRDPARCLYAGDDLRDIEAGRAAGMTTVAVRYGYLGDCPPIEQWQADYLVDRPAEISVLFGLS